MKLSFRVNDILLVFVVITSFLTPITLPILIELVAAKQIEISLFGMIRMLGNMNNVLVIVFSSEFFGPVETMVAAMYIIPFFSLVIPLRYYRHLKTKTA